MIPEYVKLAPSELSYGNANLLKSQMSAIGAIKKYNEYKTSRKEELFLKIELKKKFGELKEFLDQLDKILPESRFSEEEQEAWKQLAKITRKKEMKKEFESENISLDQELEEIRKKLERLQ